MAPAQECDAEVCEMSPLKRERVPDDSVRIRQRHNIFLSHSRSQKDFVEQLRVDLQRAKLSPFFDKDPECLPKGEEFAELILTAAKECEVAVIVISDEYFFEKKWPMLELVAVVEAGRCKILPLFYKLTCEKFKEPKRQKRWFQKWTKWAESDHESRINLNAWKNALRKLVARNGTEFSPAIGEVGYREKIVAEICGLMQERPPQNEVFDVEACALEGNQNPAHQNLAHQNVAHQNPAHQNPDADARQFQSIISPTLLKWIMIMFFPFWFASLLELMIFKFVAVLVVLYVALSTIIVPIVKEFICWLESDSPLNLEIPSTRCRRLLA